MFMIPQRFGEYGIIQNNGKLSTAQMLNLTRIRQRIYRASIMRTTLAGFQGRNRYILKNKSCLDNPARPVNLVKSHLKSTRPDNLVKLQSRGCKSHREQYSQVLKRQIIRHLTR